jgi:hypothetical protein
MRFRLFLLSAACLIGTVNFSHAQNAEQRVRNVSVKTIEKAVQCEIGHFARSIAKQKITPDRLRAAYALSEKVATNGGGGVDLGIFSWINFSTHQTQGWDTEADISFDPIHIHADNEKACSRRPDALQLLDLRVCLQRASEVYDHAHIKCGSQINVKRDLSGGVKFPIYVVTLGPEASWGTEYSQGVKVIAPPVRD